VGPNGDVCWYGLGSGAVRSCWAGLVEGELGGFSAGQWRACGSRSHDLGAILRRRRGVYLLCLVRIEPCPQRRQYPSWFLLAICTGRSQGARAAAHGRDVGFGCVGHVDGVIYAGRSRQTWLEVPRMRPDSRVVVGSCGQKVGSLVRACHNMVLVGCRAVVRRSRGEMCM
jgi:hypothetical protein